MISYKVTLASEEHNIDTTLDCSDDVFVLDAGKIIFTRGNCMFWCYQQKSYSFHERKLYTLVLHITRL